MPSPTKSDRALACAAALVFATACLVLRQSAYISDGRWWIGRVERGELGGHSPLYGALAHGSYRVAHALFGASAEATLHAVSALAGGLSIALVALAARTLGLGRAASFGGAALMGLAPTFWFFATTIEGQSILALPVACAVLWFARRRASGRLDGDALAPLALLGVTTLTHVSGGLLAPAAAVLAFFGSGRLRVPRRALVASVLVAAGAAAVVASGRAGLVELVVDSLELWSARQLAFAFVWSTGALLVPLALLGVPSLRRRVAPSALSVGLTVAAVLPFVVFVPGLDYAVARGYTLGIYPVLGLVAAFGLAACGRATVPVALACIVTQAGAAFVDQWTWRHEYEGVDWVSALVEETGGNAIVLVSEEPERHTLFNHTRLHVLSPRVGNTNFELSAPETFAHAANAIRIARSAGARVAILATLYESRDDDARVFVERLVERYGEPLPGAREEYLLFDAAPAPTRTR